MTPEDILNPFLKRFDIPDSVVKLLYLLLQREIEQNYPSLKYKPEYETYQREPAIRFAEGLLRIFSKLSKVKIYDLDDSQLVASLHQLADITENDTAILYNLCTPIARYQYQNELKWYKNEIEEYQQLIERRQPGEDVSRYRIRLRENKEALKEVDPPVDFPHLTQFWLTFLHFNVTFHIPQHLRFQHTHVLGEPYAGKTSLLEFLAHKDMQTDAAVIVMAPKSFLIPNLMLRADPERLIVFSPEYPLSVNIFDLGTIKGEVATNQTVELLNYIFGSILLADTTGKQTALINYCIRLLLIRPDSTLSTLYTLLQQETLPAEYDPFVAQLSPSGQNFFNLQFGSKAKEGYQATKKEILWRLDYVYASNPAIERMFSHTKTDLDLNKVMAQGKILLIDTSSAKNGDIGSSFLGRFFIGLVTLASQQRDTTKQLRPVYFYIDEVQCYVTNYLQSMLDRARESKVGLTLAHQRLKQLSDISMQLEDSVHTTAIKFVGKCNDDSAARMTRLLPDVEAQHLQYQTGGNFRFFAKGFLPHTLTIKANMEYLDNLPKRSEKEMQLLMARHKEPAAPLRTKTPQLPLLKAAEPEKKYTPDDKKPPWKF